MPSQIDKAAADHRVIRQIARRAIDSISGLRVAGVLSVDLQHELAACHRRCPLRLDVLLVAEPIGFATEILSIRRHLDRSTGVLGNGFVPRFADRTLTRRAA